MTMSVRLPFTDSQQLEIGGEALAAYETRSVPMEADVYQADLTKREITWTTEKDLLSALKAEKIDLKPISCGGRGSSARRHGVYAMTLAAEQP